MVLRIFVEGRALWADTRLLQTGQFDLFVLWVPGRKVMKHLIERVQALTNENIANRPR